MGARRFELAGQRVSHAAQVALTLGTVIGAAMFFGAPSLLRALGGVDELIDPATTYLKVRALGIPLMLLSFVGHGAFRDSADTRTPLGIVIGANVVNAGLTFGLVFGLRMGIAGAAWATERPPAPGTDPGQPGPVPADGGLARSDARDHDGGSTHRRRRRCGPPDPVPDVHPARVPDGRLRRGGQAPVGNALGAGDENEARAVGREMLRWGIGGGAVIAALLLLGSGIVPRLLTDDPAVMTTVAGAWWLASLGQLVNGPAFTLDGVPMGAEDYAYLRTWTMIAGLVGGVAGQTVAALGGGILGLWVAVQAMMGVRLLSLVVRLDGRGWTGTAGRVQPS